MKNVWAIPVDMTDLIDTYNKTEPEFEVVYDQNEPSPSLRMKKRRKNGTSSTLLVVDVYEVLEHFIKETLKVHPKSNFIADEVPIILDGNFLYSLSNDCHLSDLNAYLRSFNTFLVAILQGYSLEFTI